MAKIPLNKYVETRKVCYGPRFKEKGRLIDRYTRAILRNRDKIGEEYIDITNWRGTVIATLTGDDMLSIPAVTHFTRPQLRELLGLYIERNSQRFYVVEDCFNQYPKMRADKPIRVKMMGCGRGMVVGGEQVPHIVKDDEGSSEWRSAKFKFDKHLRVLCKLETFDPADYEVGIRWRSDRISSSEAAQYVQAVRESNMEWVVRTLARYMRGYNPWTRQSFNTTMVDLHKNYYDRNRREILLAAGARVAT